MSSSEDQYPLPFSTRKPPRWPFHRPQGWRAQRLLDLPLAQLQAGGSAPDPQALADLVQAWMDRLQVLSVVTTFFASMDGTLLAFVAEMAASDVKSSEVAVAGLAGALIFHIAAAIISFVASFFLLQYRIVDASESAPSLNAIASSEAVTTPPAPEHPHPHPVVLVETTPFWFPFLSRTPQPPLALLTRCHTLCIALSAAGFVLAVAGVLVYAWTALSRAVSVFSTVCLGVCVVAGVVVLW